MTRWTIINNYVHMDKLLIMWTLLHALTWTKSLIVWT